MSIRYKVGDRVRFVGTEIISAKGELGTISKVFDYGFPYAMVFDNEKIQKVCSVANDILISILGYSLSNDYEGVPVLASEIEPE